MPDVVILTGAGISAESGLETFRAEDGLWAQHRIEDVCTPEALSRNPALVHEFYNKRRAALRDVAPNAAHEALAKFSAEFPGKILVITQNVDDLHERAGQSGLLHMHGELLSLKCTRCDFRQAFSGESHAEMPCPDCGAGRLRPDIVFFGEMPYFMDEIQKALSGCEVLIAIGTSGNVYPAAGFAELARHYGAESWLVNLDPPQNHRDFQRFFQGRAGEQVPLMLDELRRWLTRA
ncbi:NAD-dependent deacylase [Falsigemmobacter intermedius]|uniref:NAD-dependent protein deacylase n=1 Tax=Falsigemmobacter intermedius TaxID=1553448 RepID=A0A444MFM2_9RHOB|nr:NAD-dependent deacylase [Falsigemmobacter intermedius]RWY44347.1 NAD-dependent deacylase [Falsigemmobacter intermedius]